MKRPAYLIILILVVAGAFLAGRWSGKSGGGGAGPGGRKILYWVDPMHPAYKSDKPGIAPDCGMQLEPVYADSPSGGAGGNGPSPMPAGALHIDSERQQVIGVRIGRVEESSGTGTLRTVGRVAPDETRIFRMATPVDGWVRSVGPIVAGSVVREDEVLATFYNRDFLTAQQTYLYALNTMDRFKASKEGEEQLKATGAQMRAAEENLEFLGMGVTQLKEVARTRQITRNIELRAPVAGVVLVRNAFLGLRFERNTELFRIADLSRVWVLADVFENEAQRFRPGMVAHVIVPRPRAVFEARVTNSVPQFDSSSRTIKIRLEAENPGFVLRPDTFVDVELPLALPKALTVPADAVLNTGLRTTVFVDRGNGYFEPRRVETGWHIDDRVQILKGLMAGEKVVVSGNFLLDSESRMKAAAAGVSAATAVSDVVCGMEVDPTRARAAGRTSVHLGTTFYFCSDQCKKSFDKDPARYARK